MAGKEEFSSTAVIFDDVHVLRKAPLSLLIAGVCENLTLSLSLLVSCVD